MDLTFRPAESRDVDVCVGMLPQDAGDDPALGSRLPDVWRRWLQADLMQLIVIEDGGRPPDARLVAFGIGAFVTDEFCRKAETALTPGVVGHLARRWLAEDSPLLGVEAVRRANSGDGLNLLIPRVGWRERDLSSEEARSVKLTLLESMFFFFRGYKLKGVLQELFSEEEKDRSLAVGARVKNDYARFYAARSGALPPPRLRPFLIGARRDEVKDGSYLASLFTYTPPRFFFAPREQELLRLALLDRTDDKLAASLSLSPATVHKRWRSIFERAAERGPDLFPTAAPGPPGPKRGIEKRRSLLSYLRRHPEELRPVFPPDK